MAQTELDQAAALNRRRLQETEFLVIAWLMRRRDAAVKKALQKGRALSAIAAALESEMQSAIVQARITSRSAGLERLQQELEALGLPPAPTQNDLRAFARDMHRAGKIATSYAKRWLKNAEREDEGDTEAAALAALDATVGSVERIGATENAEAYNAERTARARETGLEIWRVWDARLDACPICAAVDGTIVRLFEPFPIGEPGAVHPFCRCSETFIIDR